MGVGAETEAADPRVLRTREAVLRSARELLVGEGWESVTQLRVAEESGVARATIYRHWPERSALVRDVLAAEEMLLRFQPSGDLRSDVTRHLDLFRRALQDREMGRVVTALVDRSEWDPQVRELKLGLATAQHEFIHQLFRGAIADGTIDSDLDVDMAAAHLFGPILHRWLFSTADLTEDFVEAVVDGFLRPHTRCP